MNEVWQQALALLRGMWHRRWVGLAAAWIAAVVGVAIVYRIPERYEAYARVYVDTQSLLQPMLAGLAIQPNIDQQVALISRTLISRPNVEKLVRMADLDLGTKTAAARDDLIDSVSRTIRLWSGGDNLYNISFRDSDPAVASRVVQSLLAIFVESSLGDKRQDTQSSIAFVDNEIRRYEQSLEEAEGRLKDFKLKYLTVGRREGADYFSRMSDLQGAIEGARMEVAAAEQARDAYRKELAGESPTFIVEAGDTRGPEGTEFDGRIASLHKDLDSLLLKFTDRHPDVVNIRRLIGTLEAQRNAALQAQRKAAAAAPARNIPSPDRNPVFQQLRVAEADAGARVASARAKLSGLEAQYHSLKAQAELVPQVEAEYTQLNRDYQVQRKTYENLLARRDAAGMGVNVQDAGVAKFRVIDPPRVSPQPVAPNRVLLLTVALGAALAVGLAAAFVASQIWPTFHDLRILRDSTQRPVVGTVSLQPSPAISRRRRRGAALFAGGVTGLLASFGVVFAFALLFGRVG